MSTDPPPVRPPVALGCTFAVAAIVAVVAFIGFAIVFLESGADRGEITLLPAASYPEGHLEYLRAEHVHFIRMPSGDFLALSDLDAANRAASGTRCRAHQVPFEDPALREIVDTYRSRFSPAAAGYAVVFRETCNGALYDLAGVRLNGDGPNLDQLEVTTDANGRVVIDTRERTCTERVAAEIARPVECP